MLSIQYMDLYTVLYSVYISFYIYIVVYIFLWGNSLWWVYPTHYDWTKVCWIWKNCDPPLYFPSADWVFCVTLRSGSEQQRSPPPVTFGCFKSRHINNGTSRGESRLPSCLASCRSFCLAWQTQCVLPPLPFLLLLHPSTPITQSSSSRPPSLLNQTANLVKTFRKGRKKWDDKEEMINDSKATIGFYGSGTYQVNK